MKKSIAVLGIVFFSITIIGLLLQGGMEGRISATPLVLSILVCLVALMFYREALVPKWPQKRDS